MNELAKHIEYLLLDNDCVVVPQFGGFVTQKVGAERIEEEELFLPPMRTVRFNPDLQANDGLLVHSLMKTYRIEESEAKRMLHSLVLDLRQTLLENTSCDFGSMGVFTQNEDGEVSFAPCQAGTVCPTFYGLDALQFPRLQPQSAVTMRKTSAAESKPFIHKDEQHITIRINRRLINYLTATVAAVILFFMFSTPAQNTDTTLPEVSSATATLFIPQILPKEIGSTTVTTNFSEGKGSEATKESTTSNAPTTTVRPDTTVNNNNGQADSALATNDVTMSETQENLFCVVIASSITEKNAQVYVNKLTERGIQGAEVFKKGKMVRVIFSGYQTENEAYIKMNELRLQSSEFETAWVYKLK